MSFYSASSVKHSVLLVSQERVSAAPTKASSRVSANTSSLRKAVGKTRADPLSFFQPSQAVDDGEYHTLGKVLGT